jgi:hypothetical protein
MTEFRARIGKVRMKAGAQVSVIEGGRKSPEGACEGDLMREAREAAEHGEMEAFLLVTIHDGSARFSHRIERGCSFPRSLMPAYVAELIRRYALTEHDARKVFDDMFAWVDKR